MTLTDRIAKKLYELNEVRACGRVRRPWETLAETTCDGWRGEAREIVFAEVRGHLVDCPTSARKLLSPDFATLSWPKIIDAALAEGEVP